ncbi:MAG: NADH-quinone oxidoreductase subunit L [Candidatus Micrarchaeia archaeon]
MLPITYALIPLLLSAAMALLLSESTKMSAYIRHISLAASLATLLIILVDLMGPHSYSTFTWFSLAGFSFQLAFATYPLNLMLLALVGIITPLIFFYSYGFMQVPSEQGRYYFLMSLFAASMLLFAMSYSFITLFIAWELLGITSYLLIGFWYKREKPGPAARKAITTIIIGDIMMLSALIILFIKYGSLLFSSILLEGPSPILSVSLALIALAAFTKSAQFPFNEWLADAMEGPTPVSAFLHSSTMVKAGVFLTAVLLPLYLEAHLLYLFIIFGMFTALLGALNALSEHHIKRILAYSTTEDMGLMFVALGFGSVLAAMVLFVVQAFYKALLFMSAGSIMTANKTEQLHESYNLQKNKVLFAATVIGVASIAGVFPFSGFFGKILVEQSISSVYAYIALVVIEFISVLYIFRWMFVPMHKAAQDLGAEVNIGYRTLPKSMLASGVIMAVFVIAAGASFYYLPAFFGYKTASISLPDSLIESLIIAIGLLISYYAFYAEKLPSIFYNPSASHAIYTSTYVNRFYSAIARLFLAIGDALYYAEGFIYSIFRNGGESFLLFGKLLRKLENGNVSMYMLAFALGMIAIMIVFYTINL